MRGGQRTADGDKLPSRRLHDDAGWPSSLSRRSSRRAAPRGHTGSSGASSQSGLTSRMASRRHCSSGHPDQPTFICKSTWVDCLPDQPTYSTGSRWVRRLIRATLLEQFRAPRYARGITASSASTAALLAQKAMEVSFIVERRSSARAVHRSSKALRNRRHAGTRCVQPPRVYVGGPTAVAGRVQLAGRPTNSFRLTKVGWSGSRPTKWSRTNVLRRNRPHTHEHQRRHQHHYAAQPSRTTPAKLRATYSDSKEASHSPHTKGLWR